MLPALAFLQTVCAVHKTRVVPCHHKKSYLGNTSAWGAAHPGNAHIVNQRHQRVGQGDCHRWACNISFSGEDWIAIVDGKLQRRD